ncbi:MAG: nitric-oxide reductase large subunit, partial [Syntrophothermus sp.]
MNYKRLWIVFTAVVVLSFLVLGYYGEKIYREAPPEPEKVVSTGGRVLFSDADIKDGQNVWQSIGGQELGTIWGHGSYIAPDWTADWLHRESMFMLNKWARREFGASYDKITPERQALLKERLTQEVRKNTYDPQSKTLTISDLRAEAFDSLSLYYAGLFGNNPSFDHLREAYAIPVNTIKDPVRQQKMNAFFFWASWACVTERPNQNVSYTNNWPAEELVGNHPSGEIVVWSVISFVLLLAGIGGLAWYHAVANRRKDDAHDRPEWDPLLALKATPSMKATLKYFWVVAALIVVQVLLGAVTAHYGVEGAGFYGIPLSQILPYQVTRTWHTQLGIFWIATAWLATGLFIAPAISGYEPKYQKAGVNFLFFALLVIVVGSMVGEWLGVMQKLGYDTNFWFGHQGYEYVDLGRFWQAFLLIGLFLWLFLMARGMWPAFKKKEENKHLLGLFLIASAAIALFYAAGLMWGKHTNLAIAEYWRWWVVHLWVEGFFEVFATVAIAFLFTRMGLLKVATATAAVLFSTVIFLSGGIIGTFHHLYFTGTPTGVMALGATFSALEVVPLVLIGFEAYENLTLSRVAKWVGAYKWPIYFFVAVAFWNLVGAGLFGFLINPPIALYYMQ